MGLFDKMKREGLEEAEDRLGGGGFILDSDIYNAKVKVAYAITSKSGATGIVFIFQLEGQKQEYTETVYVTDREGKNYFLNKNDTSKKVALPGFQVADDICMFTTEKSLSEQDTEEKVVKVYDFDAKAEVAKSVPVLVDVIGKEVSLGILRTTENKRVKQGDEYVPTAETRDVNNIDKAFHTDSHLTVVEATKGQEAKFWDSWLERNKGKTRDKTDKNAGAQGGSSGKPPTGKAGQPAPTPGSSGGAAAPRKSLFGNKG